MGKKLRGREFIINNKKPHEWWMAWICKHKKPQEQPLVCFLIHTFLAKRIFSLLLTWIVHLFFSWTGARNLLFFSQSIVEYYFNSLSSCGWEEPQMLFYYYFIDIQQFFFNVINTLDLRSKFPVKKETSRFSIILSLSYIML